MKEILLGLILILSFVSCTVPGDGIEGCTGNQNPFELITQDPELVKEVPNGKKFTIGINFIYLDYDGRKFYIASLKGNAYEMGLAYGTLFKE